MDKNPVILITGTRKGIGKFLAERYLERGWRVIGCSRQAGSITNPKYRHFSLDVADEAGVKKAFLEIKKDYGRLDALINNAGVAGMNHTLLTPLGALQKIFNTNVVGTFLFSREAAKLMQRSGGGRIVNFTTVAVPLRLEGESVYAASKAAVEVFTKVLAKELSEYKITVNAIGPTPIKTDLIGAVPAEKLDKILQSQSIHRFGEMEDVANCIDFFLKPESSFITGQIVYLGGL